MKEFLGIGAVAAAVLVPLAGWLTHVVICIQSGSWGFLIAGAIFAPIGVIHGTGHWFGFW